jgi:DNA-binding NarL/FixJ family response regulator
MSNARKEIGILIADNHPVFRAALRRVLKAQRGFRVLGEAVDGEQALEMARRLKPQILLLDIRIPRLFSPEVLRGLKALATPVHTLILTSALERKRAVAALQLGACGILLKQTAGKMLPKGIRSVMAGQYWVCRESVPNLAQAIDEFKPGPNAVASRQDFSLSRRETEIITLVEGGYTDKDIATELALNQQAVENHLTDIFEKLGVTNRLELVLFSMDHHLTQSPPARTS